MAEFDDFGLLAQMARRELVHLLESMPEVKDLAVEPSLTRPLDKIASMSLLQQHNCARVQQFAPFTNLIWGDNSLRRVYFVRPSIANAKRISEHVRAEPDRSYSVIFVPTKLYVCELEFERNGVFGLIDIHEMDLPLISIDSHLFTLELPDFTSSILVDRTYTQLHTVAKSLWQLQSLYGLIPTVYGVGEFSAQTNRLMKKLYVELGEPRSSPDQPVSHLFLLDRNLDLTTVLLTGLTYESMLHDTFGISCGKVTFGDEVIKRMKSSEKIRQRITTLDNNDSIFSTVRDMHMTAVFPFLSAKAKSLQASYDKGSRLDEVKQMKDFVSNELRTLKQQHKLLELHICACEVVLENCKGMSDRLTLEHALISGNFDSDEVMVFLENAICRQSNQWQVLLLACLWSMCQNGIPSKYYSSFRTQFLRAYGHEYLPALHSLSLQGLLVERTSPQLTTALKAHPVVAPTRHPTRPTFQFLSRRMSLLPSTEETNINLRSPNQMRYVFSGAFTPVLCQIVGDTVTNGWNTFEMKKTFGDSVFCDQNSYTPASRPPDSRIRKAILKPRVYVAPASNFERALQEHVPCLNEVFRPTWWCPFGFLQTAVRQVFRTRPSLPFKREIVTFEDGGQTAVDWMHAEDTCDDSPIVVFLPGICGSTHDCAYILHTVIECSKLGYRSVVVNPRGLGGVALKTAQTYNAAWTSDLRHVIGLISKRYANARKIGCGFSMGGMILWNYLAECSSAKASGLSGAICISSPFNPFESSINIEKLFPRVFFNSVLAANLKSIVKPYKTMFEGRCNWDKVMTSKTVRDFDKAFTVPLFGYKDWNEYYHAAALYWKVHRIPIPTLCLNAVDDCFSPIDSIPFADVVRSKNVAIAVTQHGGHTAFMRKANPNAPGLVEDVIKQYATMIFNHFSL
ncbi:Putative esterase C44C1.5 [Toxocara canis]|uniref:Putative esterase C44C1.5 n=1 Tax=Toxocara canis TaxID=6265 RepID=A0A0B2VXI6_TOXCA|nr:Putative esterase C44C1.5 [Toxocara canis]